MKTYNCFFAPYDGEVDHLIVIEARDDTRACVLAGDHLTDHATYSSVEIYEDERLVGQLHRTRDEQLIEEQPRL